MPAGVDSVLTHNDSVSLLTLPADNGTWGVGITTSSRDRALRALRHVPCWEAAMRCYPATAGWIDAEPITGVSVMAGIEDRQRQLVVDSVPVVTGLVAVGDAWACTNPSLGRGASIGALHACVLRDVVAKEGTADPDALVLRFAAETAATVAPYVDSTLWFDRHRLAEIEADVAGVPYQPDGPGLGDDARVWRRRAGGPGGGPGAGHDRAPCRRHPGRCWAIPRYSSAWPATWGGRTTRPAPTGPSCSPRCAACRRRRTRRSVTASPRAGGAAAHGFGERDREGDGARSPRPARTSARPGS